MNQQVDDLNKHAATMLKGAEDMANSFKVMLDKKMTELTKEEQQQMVSELKDIDFDKQKNELSEKIKELKNNLKKY
jgi:hypothetical protein